MIFGATENTCSNLYHSQFVCIGTVSNKIYCTNPLINICLKFNDKNIKQIEDLIIGTQFIKKMDKTLKKYALE